MGWFLLLPSPIAILGWTGSGWRNVFWGGAKAYKTRRGAEACLARLEKEGLLSPGHGAKVTDTLPGNAR